MKQRFVFSSVRLSSGPKYLSANSICHLSTDPIFTALPSALSSRLPGGPSCPKSSASTLHPELSDGPFHPRTGLRRLISSSPNTDNHTISPSSDGPFRHHRPDHLATRPHPDPDTSIQTRPNHVIHPSIQTISPDHTIHQACFMYQAFRFA